MTNLHYRGHQLVQLAIILARVISKSIMDQFTLRVNLYGTGQFILRVTTDGTTDKIDTDKFTLWGDN